MGRAGIGYSEIEEAAHRLQGQGKAPTVDSIRALLGTGSKTTIANHLKAWRASQSEQEGQLPQDLSALVKGLWERLHAQADERIKVIQITMEEKIKEAQISIDQLQKELLETNTALIEEKLLKESEKLNKEELSTLYHHEQQALVQLMERYEGMERQLKNAKEENARLHQLAHTMQKNLEHYQQAMQQLQTEQTLAIEQQRIEYKNQLASAANQQQEVMLQLQGLQTEKENLLKDFQENMESKNIRLIELEKKNAALIAQTSYLEDLSEIISNSQAMIEKLNQEKLVLIKENAQLEGFFQHLIHYESSDQAI